MSWVESEGNRWREFMVLTIEPLQCKISKLSLNGQKQLLK